MQLHIQVKMNRIQKTMHQTECPLSLASGNQMCLASTTKVNCAVLK